MPYMIPPAPVITDPNLQVCDLVETGQLTPAQLTAIRAYGDHLLATEGHVARVGYDDAAREDEHARCSRLAWLRPDLLETAWLFARIAHAAQDANARFWQYDLWGFHDELQYTFYDGARAGHFTWHQDRSDATLRPQRKLSVVLLLSDPGEYGGGDFEIFDGFPVAVKAKAAGTLLVFPSFMQHRVSPVTWGERRSIVGWLCGPKFR
jgi:PKHD-type hydroxylase